MSTTACAADQARLTPSQLKSAAGRFSALQDMALNAPQHRLYVIDRNNHQIQLFNSVNLVSIKKFGSNKLRFPQDLTLTPNQLLLVADGKLGTVVKWDVRHLFPRYHSTVRFPNYNIHAIAAIDAHTYVLLDAQRNRLSLVKNDKILWEIGKLGQGEQQFRNPTDVYYHAGKIYVADTGNRRIVVFNERLQHQLTLNKQADFSMLKPIAVAVDNKGLIYVADEGHHKIWIFSQNYQLLTSIGYLPHPYRRKLYRPNGVTAANGKVWFSSASEPSLTVFQLQNWHRF